MNTLVVNPITGKLDLVNPNAECYPNCRYVVKNPATWNPAATSAADLDGCTTLAVGDRILCPSGTHAWIWVATSATTCVRDASFAVIEGYSVTCVRSYKSPSYRQTAATGSVSPRFELQVGSYNASASSAIQYVSIYTLLARIQAIAGTALVSAFFPDDATVDGSGHVLTVPARGSSDVLTERHTSDYFTLSVVNGRKFITNSTNTNKSLQTSNGTTKHIVAVLIPAATVQTASFGSAVGNGAAGNSYPELIQGTNSDAWYGVSWTAIYVNGAPNPYIYPGINVYATYSASGTTGLAVGGLTAAAFDFKGQIGLVLQFSAQLADDQLVEIAQATREFYSAARLIPCILDGDSLTADGSGAPPWPYNMHADPRFVCHNFGRSGYTMTQMVADIVSRLARLDFGEQRKVIVIGGGTNDLANDSAATVYARIVNYCATVRALGWSVAVCTIQARDDTAWSSAKETERLLLNALLLTNWSTFADGLIDVAAAPELTDPTNLTYFQNDKIHNTAAGYAARARVVGAWLASLV